MSKHNVLSRIIVAALLLGPLLGAGVGWALAAQTERASLSPPGGEEPQVRPEAVATQFYKRLTGNSFRPGYHGTTYVISSSVCLHRSDATAYGSFTYDLQLPDGAEVNQLTFYYYDALVFDSAHLELKANDGFGSGTTLVSINSVGLSGYGSVDSSPFSYVVDNFKEVLTLSVFLPAGTSSDLSVCGVRVGYKYNLASLSLPVVLNQATP